jgi:hypothetical protein
VVVVIVVLVDDADAEGFGVAKFTKVNAFNVDVRNSLDITSLEEGVDADEFREEFMVHLMRINDGGPVGRIALTVKKGITVTEAEEILVSER